MSDEPVHGEEIRSFNPGQVVTSRYAMPTHGKLVYALPQQGVSAVADDNSRPKESIFKGNGFAGLVGWPTQSEVSGLEFRHGSLP